MRLPPVGAGFLLLAVACQTATGPAVTLGVTTPPSFASVILNKTHVIVPTSIPPFDSFYDLSVTIPPADTVVLPALDSVPVFVRNRFGLARTTVDRIRLRDSVDVWYGGFWVTQVVIVQ
jgi:hypothetical protein